MTKRVALLLSIFVATPAVSAVPVAGQWLTPEKDSVIEIAPCGPALCGRVSRILRPNPKGATVDANNPNPALRNRPILGLTILSGFKDDGKSWRGSIYDPRAGKTYKSFLQSLPDGRLKVQGCLGPFCQSQYWTRAR